ncbi:hypothetical protein [Pectobacterium cacticida]|uniref:hypothetical protein n=1 Tax=Pectobacterium cacticida TaxID=69221 RepID=UPI0035ED4F97
MSEWQQKKIGPCYRRKEKRQHARIDLLAVGKPGDLAIEAIRSLRTSLHFAMMEAKNKRINDSAGQSAIGKTL